MPEALRPSDSRFGAHVTDSQQILLKTQSFPFPPHKGPAARQIIMDARHPTTNPPNHQHRPQSHPQNPLYPPHTLPNINSLSSQAMDGPTTLAYYNQDTHYFPRAPHPPQTNLLTTSVSPNHLTLTAPSGLSGFDHSDGLVYGQHHYAPRWSGISSESAHGQSISPHDSTNAPPQPHPLPMMSHSQAPNQTYQISPVTQSVNPLIYNDMLQMPQSQGNFLQPQDSYVQPRTTTGWTIRAPGTAVAPPNLDPLGGIDTRSKLTNSSPTSPLPPAVGRQGTRGILPTAPGKEDPAPEEEIEPIQDPETKKWQCPSCPATFSFPKHVKRHYMRHTGERPYECLCCNTCFARSDVLKRHYEKCAERTPGWREIPAEERADHLQGRRGRPKRSSAKKQQSRRRQGRTPGASGQNSTQSSRRSSRDGRDGEEAFSSLTMTAGHIT